MKHKRLIQMAIFLGITLVPFFIYRSTVTETKASGCTQEMIQQTLEQNRANINDIIQKEILFNLVLVGLQHGKEHERKA